MPCAYILLSTSNLIGKLYETIPQLENGSSNCSFPIEEDTGTMCSFICKKGFDIDGSTSRICQTNQKWNGTMTKCKSKLTIAITSYLQVF